MNLLDLIAGQLNGGGGMPPDAMPINMGGFPGEQPPVNFPPGGVPPMPAPRPPGADMMTAPAAMPMGNGPQDDGSMPPGAPLNLSGAPPQPGLGDMIMGPRGRDLFRTAADSLAGGLKSINGQPFAGQAFGNGMGSAIEGGSKSEQQEYENKLKTLDRALKLRAIDNRADSDDELADNRRVNTTIRGQRVTDQGEIGRTVAGARVQDAATRATVAPTIAMRNTSQAGAADARAGESGSRIALNNSRIGLNDARTTDIAAGGNPSVRLGRADAGVERWYKTESANLRDEMTRVQSSPMKFADKEAALGDLRGKLANLRDRYDQRLVANRRAHGFNPDGTPIQQEGAAPAPGKPPAAPGSEISMQGDGTRQAPYRPTTPQDFNDLEPGTHFIDPGDGKLYVK